MSLGWQCESALLPSKATPINVDAKSMVGLKAHLYNEELQRQAGGSRASAVQRTKAGITKSRRDDLLLDDRKVKAVEKNSASTGGTGADLAPVKTEDQVAIALAAKAKLYDQILAGKAKLSSDLVNFDDKVSEGYVVLEKKPETVAMPPPRPPAMPKPEFVDLSAASAQRSSAGTGSAMVQPPASVNDGSSTPHYNWSTSYNSTHETAASTGSKNSESSTSGRSSREYGYAGEYGARDYNREYREEAERERQLRRAVEEKIHAEAVSYAGSFNARSSAYNTYTGRSDDGAGNDSNVPVHVSEAARVKTQWEKTLNSSARSFLDDIHMDTARQREQSAEPHVHQSSSGNYAGVESGQKRSAKEERLELIRQKRSKSGLC